MTEAQDTYVRIAMFTLGKWRLSNEFDPWDFVSLLWIKHGTQVPHVNRLVWDILDYVREERKLRVRYGPAGLCPVPDETIAGPAENPPDPTVLNWFSGGNPADWYVARLASQGMGPTAIGRSTGVHKTQVIRDMRRMAAAIAA